MTKDYSDDVTLEDNLVILEKHLDLIQNTT